MLKSNKCKDCGSLVVDLLDIPDNVVFSPDAIQITKVDVPLYLPDGIIGGKARIIEGEDENAVLIEIESSNPLIAELFKGETIGVSLVHRPPNRTFVKEV